VTLTPPSWQVKNASVQSLRLIIEVPMALWLYMMSQTAVRVSYSRIRSNSRPPPIESFENVRMWLKEIERYAADYVEKLLIGNKSDLVSKKVVEYSIAKVWPLTTCRWRLTDRVLGLRNRNSPTLLTSPSWKHPLRIPRMSMRCFTR